MKKADRCIAALLVHETAGRAGDRSGLARAVTTTRQGVTRAREHVIVIKSAARRVGEVKVAPGTLAVVSFLAHI